MYLYIEGSIRSDMVLRSSPGLRHCSFLQSASGLPASSILVRLLEITSLPTTAAIVLKGYPRLSETFIAQEIHALEQRGLEIQLVSLRHPTDPDVHPVHREIRAPVSYLPEYLHAEPLRVLRAWWNVRGTQAYRETLRLWLRDLRRDFTRSRVRRFGQALVLAAELPDSVGYLYAHFLHTPASVTRYASRITGVRWSCSAHAKDIWTTPDWDLSEKLAECEWLVTCTAANTRHLQSLAPQPERVELLYHGLNLQRFPPPTAPHGVSDGSLATDPVTILSVGRAVAKKGYDDLLRALAKLPKDCHWRFVHIGGGALLDNLQSLSRELGIEERITWEGALPQQEVLERYRAADIFALASRITSDGDRDGLPNVLLEAQSQKLACLATNISGIPELITHDVSGLLVDERDQEGLAAALKRLVAEPELRRRLGDAGFERVCADFSMDGGIDRLMQKFSAS